MINPSVINMYLEKTSGILHNQFLRKGENARYNIGSLNLFKSVAVIMTDGAGGKRPKVISPILTESKRLTNPNET